MTRNVEQAKAGVAELESQLRDLDAEIGRLRPAEGAPGAEGPAEGTGRLGDLQARHAQIDAEIRRLRETISAASDEAARAVSERAGGSSRHVA